MKFSLPYIIYIYMDANMKHKKTLDQQFLKNYIAVIRQLINIFLGIF